MRDASPPCDINSISILNVHEFECSEKFWASSYGTMEGKKSFHGKITGWMGDYGGRSNQEWSDYFAKQDVWVTATNCNNDEDSKMKKGVGQGTLDQCNRAIGNKKDTHGQGGVKTIAEIDRIKRVSWYLTYNKRRDAKH